MITKPQAILSINQELLNLKPWKYFHDIDVFVIEDPQTKVNYYCSIQGRIHDEISIYLYPGESAYHTSNRIVNVSDTEALYLQEYFRLILNDIPTCIKKEKFKSPKEIDIENHPFLQEIFHQVLEVCKYVNEHRELLLEDELCWVRKKVNSTWLSRWEDWKEFPEDDFSRVGKMTNFPKAEVWEDAVFCEMRILEFEKSKDSYEIEIKMRNLKDYDVIDECSGSLKNYMGLLEKFLVQFFEKHGYPKMLVVNQHSVFNFLEDQYKSIDAELFLKRYGQLKK